MASNSNTLHDGQPAQTEPILATQIPRLGIQRHKSRKSIATQAKILALKAQGATNTEISTLCETDRNTVARILNSADIQQHVSEIRSDMVLNGDLVVSAKVLRSKLRKGSESAATTILRGFNVLQSNPKVEVNVLNVSAASYAQRMQARAQEAIELQSSNTQAETTITSVSSESDKTSTTST